jgi:surfactin synthase thioesterase subunit
MSKIKLFCIPYAGGTSLIYSQWKRYLSAKIELCPIELAGRGSRIDEKLYETFDEAVDDVYNIIMNKIDDGYFAFFGHSMGSWIAYELSYKLKKLNRQYPLHIFFSGRRAPHISERGTMIHLLPQEEFKHEVMKMGGTSREILNNGLFDYFSDIMRADFKIVSEYAYRDKEELISCDISIFSGKKDRDIKINDLIGWKKHAGMGCSICKFGGGHFFILDQKEDVISTINSTLLKYVF